MLHTSRCPIIDFFEMHMSQGRVDPRRAGRPGGRPAARGRRHQALQLPHAGHRVRHRARRRAEPAGPGPGRRDPRGAVAVRQDADHDVPRPAARRSSSPTTRCVDEDLETDRPAAARSPTLGDRCFGLIATPARLSQVRQRASARTRPTPRSSSARKELRRADALYRANGIPVINSTTRSVEEMSTLILQTLGFPTPSRKKPDMSNVLWFSELGMTDLEQVGGKNASLGEMVSNLASAGVRVPGRVRDHRGRLPSLHRPAGSGPDRSSS